MKKKTRGPLRSIIILLHVQINCRVSAPFRAGRVAVKGGGFCARLWRSRKKIHSLISGANCFILQIPMLSLGLFTLAVHIITRGEAEGNNVKVEGK